MVNFLISDEDVEFSIMLNNYIAPQYSNIKICSICNNFSDTLKKILTHKPNIIILGISFKEIEIKQIFDAIDNDFNYNPYIIKLKRNNKLCITQNYNNYYEITITDFNFNTLAVITHKVMRKINKLYIREYATKELCKLNFNMSSIGTKYLIDCIVLAQKSPFLLENLEKNLYKKVSILNATTNKHIKWNINKCIDSMFRYCNHSFIMNYFSFYDKRKPTAKVIITTIVNKYDRNQLKQLY